MQFIDAARNTGGDTGGLAVAAARLPKPPGMLLLAAAVAAW